MKKYKTEDERIKAVDKTMPRLRAPVRVRNDIDSAPLSK